MKNITVIAVEFETAGNCGALARICANFNVSSLIFVNPRCDFKSAEALQRAKHAQNLLLKAQVVQNFDDARKMFNYLAATTAIIGSDYNVPRLPLSPETFAEKAAELGKIGLVLGREGEGLHNDEIRKCDFSVTIPASKKYQTLNVTHAASILLYEIFKRLEGDHSTSHIRLALKRERDALFFLIDATLDRLDFSTSEKRETQKEIWRRVLQKALLTKREVNGLFGFFKKVK